MGPCCLKYLLLTRMHFGEHQTVSPTSSVLWMTDLNVSTCMQGGDFLYIFKNKILDKLYSKSHVLLPKYFFPKALIKLISVLEKTPSFDKMVRIIYADTLFLQRHCVNTVFFGTYLVKVSLQMTAVTHVDAPRVAVSTVHS